MTALSSNLRLTTARKLSRKQNEGGTMGETEREEGENEEEERERDTESERERESEPIVVSTHLQLLR